MAEFVTPEFLQNRSPEDNMDRIQSVLPADIDISGGSHEWNFTYPTALQLSELAEFVLAEVVKLILPEWSYGDFLDGHAKGRCIYRRAGTAATGNVTVTGAANTFIPAGSVFSTAAINDIPSVDYATKEDVEIGGSGTVIIPVECTQVGVVGNTMANTVVFASSKLTGITSVVNDKPMTGGTEEETDESLSERISEYDRGRKDSYGGSAADYKRWATSVSGVGEATVIPANDDSGLVRIYLADTNGDPATMELCTDVYNYIMRPDGDEMRLAPINAYLSVEPPPIIKIGIRATIELEQDATIEAVKDLFYAKLAQYLPGTMEDGEVKYTKVAALLSNTEGVNDYSGLLVGVIGDEYGTENIPVAIAHLPSIAAEYINLSEGTV